MGCSWKARIGRLLGVAGLASLLLVPKFAAQEGPNVGRRLSLVVGPVFVSQRDEKASPVRYGGTAPFAEVAYTTQTSRRKLDLRLGGAIGTLRSALTQSNSRPQQRIGRGWVNVEYDRALSAAHSTTRWLLGGRLSASGTVIHHAYASAAGNDQGYAFFSTTLGPVAAVERVGGERTTLSAALCVPILALIGRPYSVFAPFYDHPHPNGIDPELQLTTVGAFQAADFTAAYTAHRSGADMTLGYNLIVERYRDAEPFRFASQSISLTVALRVGRP